MKLLCLIVLLALGAPTLPAASYYTLRANDPEAVYLERGSSGLRGDGIADDSEAIQRGIDRVQETKGQGIIFLPQGRYRITKTIYIWPGVRLIGYGAERPTLFLGKDTAGFQSNMGYMVFFAGARIGGPARPGTRRPASNEPFAGTVPPQPAVDSSPGTFYSAMSNIDIEIGDGNPAAVGIRSHYAQHCFLSHMDFRLGSGLAGIHDAGNEAEDLHFQGGDYGIITQKPSPGWQFTLLDSSFEGQRKAAIKEHEAGLTLVNATIRNVPEAISIDSGYAEELWVQDSLFEDISGPAITISNEHNARTEINLQNVVARNVPVFAHLRESGRDLRGRAPLYRVKSLSHGLTMQGVAGPAAIKTSFDTEALTTIPAARTPVIRNLPARDTWVNLRSLGAKGDGIADDTQAILNAIRDHDTIYVPSGRYRVSDTIALQPRTALIGLHPSTTQFFVDDASDAFNGPGAPKPLLLAPAGGHNIVSGIGLYPGGINSRAAGAMWMAGADSLMSDVRFLGGHGTNNADGTRVNPYNANHTADPDPRKRWDAQYPSLWVLNGGGGTFSNIWTPDTFAQAGMYISDTTTPGHVYELSSEHHVRTELKLDRVGNWELMALQAEEEHGEGAAALPLEINQSKNILIANFHSYRVVGSHETFPYAVRVTHSDAVRFRNLHIDSDSKVSFNDGVYDQAREASERFREIANLTLSSGDPGPALPDPQVRKLTGGFYNISGSAVDSAGSLYFVDTHTQKIYRWSPEMHLAQVIRDAPLDPANLAIDRSGNLMVTSYAGNGTVYTFKPDAPGNEITVLKPQPSSPHPGKEVALAADLWKLRGPALASAQVTHEFQYASPDGSLFLSAGKDFVDGALYYGTKMADVLRTFGLVRTRPGQPFYITDEEEQKTWRGTVGEDGSVQGLKLFAERGGESVATDAQGNVYIAAGQIFVYNPAGEYLRTITVPERPINLVFGGKDGRTLYILARTSLYSAWPPAPAASRKP
jgi:sugar lactone lactonase YvrE/polygalacturonase